MSPEEYAFPLSFAQERLWFLHRLEPESAAYNVPSALRLEGALDEAALRQALADIVGRHEVLRTTYREGPEGPLQVVGSPPDPARVLATQDLGPLPAERREAEAQRLAREDAAAPFDLEHGPVVRAKLLRLAPQEHVLLLAFHHIAFDGWSVGVFVQELAACYEARAAGKEPGLAELPIQYADFAVWQREQEAEGVLAAHLDSWRKRLEGVPPLELPLDKPRPPVQTYGGRRREVAIPKATLDQVKALAQAEGATLFMPLLAAWQALLHRYSRQDDIAVGSAIAGRNRAETEGLIGFFVNTLVLRSDLSGNPTFRELLRRVRDTCFDAYAHQDVPFERLVEALQPERDPSRTPFFQTMFALQNAPGGGLRIGSLKVAPLAMPEGTAKFDLTLALLEHKDGLRGGLSYRTDLFEDATAARMVAHFTTLLEAAAKAPDTPVAKLPLLGQEERQQVLEAWNATRAPYDASTPVHRLVEAQAARHAGQRAVVGDSQALTYGELNGRANQLAHLLREAGIGPGKLVGICLRRSPDLLVAFLAVAKAGGAYVPIDPDYPPERIRFMLQDSAAPVVLTEARLAGEVGHGSARVVRLDADWPGMVAHRPAANHEGGAKPEDLAYVIYTSGSTGQPKGVLIEHRALANLVAWHIASYKLRPGDHTSQVASPAFDATVWEVWPALAAGCEVHLPDDGTRTDPQALQRWLLQHRVAVSFVPTPIAEPMMQLPWPASTPLRHLLTGGDKLHRGPPGPLPFTLVNHYGPTESTVVSTAAPVPALPQDARAPPIGRPIANLRALVLDAHLQPVPVGVAGEVHVGGDGLARGYLNRPELTAEKFVPDPFHAGQRLYKTGDLARWRPDGQLEFLGRTDFQVKVRGYRIELGEIETALAKHPGVREAVVLARKDDSGPPRLVAYVLPRGAAPTAAELRAALKKGLPDYMVPAHYVVLEAFPLTPNGKVDRAALPAPSGARPEQGEAFLAPRTPEEEAVAQVWADVLKVERVGARDDFFALGGHSLMATQVVARLRGVFGVELPVRAVFEAPTVAELAKRVVEARGAQGMARALPPIQPRTQRGDAPLSFAQQRLWFLHKWDPASPAYLVPAALRLRGPLRDDALRASLNHLLERHEALRTVFPEVGGKPVQRVLPAQPLALAPEPARTEDEARRLAKEEARRPMDLAQGPVFRARLLRLGREDHVLLLTFHHIAFDGWSLGGVFVPELVQLYHAFARGEPSPLPPLPIQYADYASWEQARYASGELEPHLAHWRARLQGVAPLDLPTDKPRPPQETHRGAKLAFKVPKPVADGLRALAREEGATLFMPLMAAWQALLHRHTGQDDFAVGSPIAGRTREETEGLVGFFINTLVLRADLAGQPTFRELLARTKLRLLDAYAHQGVPFEKLVEELQPDRDPSRSPLFQAMLIYQNLPRAALRLGDVQVEPLASEGSVAKFELTLTFADAGDEGLGAALEYNTDLFEEATAQRLAGHLGLLLEAVVRDPDLALADLPLVDAKERALLESWNATEAPFPRDARLAELLEAQCKRTPERVAVQFRGQRLTYRELDARAEALAARLRALGAGPDVLVGVALDRSLDTLPALFAVLKSGAAFVPLDPSHPPERLRYILEDAKVPILLTQRAHAGLAPPGAQVLAVDAPGEPKASKPSPRKPAPTDLAYVLYTSGSTGKPKGTLVEQRGLVNLLHAMARNLGITPEDRVLALTTFSFDIAEMELWMPLLLGAQVELAPREAQTDPRELAKLLEQVTVAQGTPATWRLLVDSGWKGKPGLKVVAGGEELTVPLAKELLARAGEVWNGYGPTETTVYSTLARVVPGEAARGRIPIGKPLANTRCYVVDARGKLAPVGVAGELLLGGEGVGRGYLNQPQLTAERFVQDPFQPGARVYRTGDLVRWRADGQLEFLGRRDHQVKVRGFRIELGEVEAALQGHPKVREAAVLAVGDGAAKRLVAYATPATGAQLPTVEELRAFLARTLPDYMVPAQFVGLDAMPLTPSGKVDRRRLPEPSQGQAPALGQAYVAPTTPEEEMLAQAWQELLRVPRVGIHDNFFALGGHSLLATQVLSRVREAFGVEVPVRDFFQEPTVAGLGQRVLEALTKQIEALGEEELARLTQGEEGA